MKDQPEEGKSSEESDEEDWDDKQSNEEQSNEGELDEDDSVKDDEHGLIFEDDDKAYDSGVELDEETPNSEENPVG